MIQVSDGNEKKPFVSVIIPVYNGVDEIEECLDGLIDQTYPTTRREILVVDNGSTDGTPELVRQYEEPQLLEEHQTQSSYAARNKGITTAQGEIIAMIDADCRPVPDWIQNGVKCLCEKSADLAGGNVEFTFNSHRSYAELYDSITNMQIEENIRNRNVAKTANLFAKKCVFESIGLFPSQMKSGGDVRWTGRATNAGFDLVYAPKAKVYHPARTLRPLLKKMYRVGRGQRNVKDKKFGLFQLLWGFRPPSPITTRSVVRNKCEPNDSTVVTISAIFFITWVCRIVAHLGWITTISRQDILTKHHL